MARTIGFFYTLFLHLLVFLVSEDLGTARDTFTTVPPPTTLRRRACARPLLSPSGASGDDKPTQQALWLGQQPVRLHAGPSPGGRAGGGGLAGGKGHGGRLADGRRGLTVESLLRDSQVGRSDRGHLELNLLGGRGAF